MQELDGTRINGFSKNKAKKYGQRVIDVVNMVIAAHGGQAPPPQHQHQHQQRGMPGGGAGGSGAGAGGSGAKRAMPSWAHQERGYGTSGGPPKKQAVVAGAAETIVIPD